MNLFPFQDNAILEIRDKFLRYLDTSSMGEKKDKPFIQFLRAITGAGKTPILAGAISEMAQAVAPAPIVLWTSKTSAVVSQTLMNFDNGGKYHTLLHNFTAKDISEVVISDLYDVQSKLLITSTVASFNRASKDGLHVFVPRPDQGANLSLWDALIHRKNKPLFIVYDEGHNTTDNQIDLLLELQPEVILLASATPKITPRLHELIDGEPDKSRLAFDKVLTTVETRDVVENELIKSTIRVTDYDNPEEFVLKDMVMQYRRAEQLAVNDGIAVRPKCIYVSTTNEPGDTKRPFHQRKARPIVIWRTLVEKVGIDPNTIAVYCSLQGSEFPDDFHLVKNFEELQQGDFRHIIFNLRLQEGWDDPEVYFAYVDKTMRSAREITQIIGRVLRQPHAKRTPYETLNSAHFFINCSSEKFKKVIEEIRDEIGTHYNDPKHDYIHIVEQPKTPLAPLPVKNLVDVPLLPKLATRVEDDFIEELMKKLQTFPDYRNNPGFSKQPGEQYSKVVAVKTGKVEDGERRRQGIGQVMQVGEIFRKELLRKAKDAAESIDGQFTYDEKFAVEVCYSSVAANDVRTFAEQVARLYLDFVVIEPGIEMYTIPPFQPSSSLQHQFSNALHTAYDELNSDEEHTAKALDQLGHPWFRNVPNGSGYKIPLPLSGTYTQNFYPDFVVLGKKTIWCVEPKGAHLLTDAIQNKLIGNIRLENGLTMKVFLVVKGTYDKVDNKIEPKNKEGVTLLRRIGTRADLVLEQYPDYSTCFRETLQET